MAENENMGGYKFFRSFLGVIYKFWYNPKIIGSENIPTDGPIVVVGNHVHIMDQCNVIVVTKRPIHYLAKKEYFDGKGFDLPKKCQSCRGVRQPTYNSSYNYTSRTPTPVPRPTPQATPKPAPKPAPEPKESSFCFITTAVCSYLGKSDDCYELTTLRRFRDGWLAKQNNGLDLIQEYYSIAPQIVDAINASEKKDQTYTHIWEDYIKPCITLIELSAYETCKDLYMKMVRELKEAFAS